MTIADSTTQTDEMVTVRLAEWAGGLRLADVPEETVQRVRQCLLDTIGCIAFGSRLEWSRIVNEWVRRQGGAPLAGLWTTDFRGPAASVALGTGTMAHAFDIDDYHNAKLHPGAVVIPAALALAEARGVNGKRTLAAIVAGYEVMIRTSLALQPGPTRLRGWHLTGVCGSIGAAAACANLLGLDATGTASALGLAGTQSSGLWAFTADGSMSKRFHAGRAAQSGIIAVELAELGYAGPTRILEAKDGGVLNAFSPSPRPELALDQLGVRFHAGDTAIKPYSACGSLHSSVDALLQLVAEHRIEPAQVEQVTLRTSPVIVQQCGFDFQPLSVLQAQMSAQYVLAVSLLDGHCLPAQFTEERLHAPEVLELVRRVQVVDDPVVDRLYPEQFAAIVDIILRDGRIVSTRVDDPTGSAARPLSDQQVREKFDVLIQDVYPSERGERIVAMVEQFETLGQVGELAKLLAR